ncbi:MAG TPA: hypothetical protein VFK05_16110 [Polyangiaceae bacterium]|nr:hypothetical protein [Polyangiaceae bacterium]
MMRTASGFCAPTGAPEWLVCNAGVTVGPVRTDLLLRGVIHGRVPSSAWVRQTGWQNWRELRQIREVSALIRVLDRRVDDAAPDPASLLEGAETVARATDAGEALLIALHAAALATSSAVGLVHRVRQPLLLPTLSCVFEAPSERLGEVLPWFDPALALARAGQVQILSGSGERGGVEQTVAARLSPGGPLSGIAILPIMVEGQLCAMLELGRSDHPFRTNDSAELANFAQQVAVVLAGLGAARRLPSDN